MFKKLFKKKQEMAKKVINTDKEADQIFVKNNQTGPMTKYKNKITGLYPKVNEHSDPEYANEVARVKKQVNDFRNK